jgi:hypothetical protein
MRSFVLGVSAAVLALCIAASASASINYNASKSNTGNVTLHCIARRGHPCVTPHAPTHGAHTGRRRHWPLTVRRTIDSTTPARH